MRILLVSSVRHQIKIIVGSHIWSTFIWFSVQCFREVWQCPTVDLLSVHWVGQGREELKEGEKERLLSLAKKLPSIATSRKLKAHINRAKPDYKQSVIQALFRLCQVRTETQEVFSSFMLAEACSIFLHLFVLMPNQKMKYNKQFKKDFDWKIMGDYVFKCVSSSSLTGFNSFF